jgi:hypothetical protein
MLASAQSTWQSTWYGSTTFLGSVGDYSEEVRNSICDRMREAFNSQYPDCELDLAALEANIRLSRQGVESISPEVTVLPFRTQLRIAAPPGF